MRTSLLPAGMSKLWESDFQQLSVLLPWGKDLQRNNPRLSKAELRNGDTWTSQDFVWAPRCSHAWSHHHQTLPLLKQYIHFFLLGLVELVCPDYNAPQAGSSPSFYHPTQTLRTGHRVRVREARVWTWLSHLPVKPPGVPTSPCSMILDICVHNLEKIILLTSQDSCEDKTRSLRYCSWHGDWHIARTPPTNCLSSQGIESIACSGHMPTVLSSSWVALSSWQVPHLTYTQ